MNEATNPITAYQYFIASPYFAGLGSANDETVKSFTSSYVSLPQSLKDFIASEETATTITLVAIKYELQEKQISQLAQTLRELVLGSVFIKDLPGTLTTKLGVDEAKAQEIINKIVSESFGPIIEDVKRIQRSKFPDKIMQLQKEGRPEGLSSKPQVPESAKNMPLNQPSARPVPTQQAQTPPPPRPIQASPQNQPLPSLQGGSVRPPQPTSTPVAPIQAPPAPPNQPAKPLYPAQSKPAFKIPDIGQPFSMMEKTTAKNEPSTQKTSPAIKSLEEELAKVGSVVDLRNKT